ncbi:Uncharacterised protein [Yersinia frederiksenii]|nr:hypothetical protein [Yersinia frederiksenii]CNL28071.1 Uncharacterised protein [Yersinia frederiksenii]
MTVAKDTSNDEIIHGNNLRGMSYFYVRTTEFQCPYSKCKIKATPCSFKLENKKQSYFRYDENHKAGCGIHDPKNRNRHDSNDEKKHNSPPAPIISILKLDSIQVAKGKCYPRTPGEGLKEYADGNEHPVSSSSIKPVVDYYINSNDHSEFIAIPPYGKRTYKHTFQRIIFKDRIRYITPAIYFGVIQSNTAIERDSSEYNLIFLARNKESKQAFKLKIDVSEWNESQKDVFYKEFEKQRIKAETYRKMLWDKKTKKI